MSRNFNCFPFKNSKLKTIIMRNFKKKTEEEEATESENISRTKVKNMLHDAGKGLRIEKP